MKTLQAKTLRDIYNMSRKWIVKGKDTPLNIELKLTLDESSNLITVETLGENITDKDDSPSLFD
nr:MAG TPA: hypothetical protein [Caudoviricetes sp.]